MKKIALVAGLVLAASVAVAPLAFAQTDESPTPSAEACAVAKAAVGAAVENLEAQRESAKDADAEAAKQQIVADNADIAAATAKKAADDADLAGNILVRDAQRAILTAKLAERDAARAAVTAELKKRDDARAEATELEATLEADKAAELAARDAACIGIPGPAGPQGPVFVDLNCGDFPLPDGRTAQQVLDATPGQDPHRLDLDDDRVACEIDEPIDDGNDTDTDGDYTQVRELPTAIDTGRTL